MEIILKLKLVQEEIQYICEVYKISHRRKSPLICSSSNDNEIWRYKNGQNFRNNLRELAFQQRRCLIVSLHITERRSGVRPS